MKRPYKYIILILILYLPFKGMAQFGSYGITNARNVGMANTYTANSYGLFSIGTNPGLLNKNPGGEEISILFPSLVARGYGISRTLESFNYYVGAIEDQAISRLDEDDILEAMTEGGGLSLSAVVGFFSFGIKPSEEIGTFAFTMTDYIAAYLYFPGFIAETLNDNKPLNGSVSLNEFSYKTWWIRSYGLSYSRSIYDNPNGRILKSVSGGASIKYYNGFVYQDIVVNASVASSTQDTLFYASFDATARGSFSSDLTFLNFFETNGNTPDNFLFPKAAGKRMGFDIGFSAEFHKGITVGMAFTDIGKLDWNSNAGSRKIEASFAILGSLDEELIDSISADASVSRRTNETFSTPLPTTMRLGAAVQLDQLFKKFPGQMRLAFDFNKGFNNQPSNAVKPRYSIGLEYQPAKKAPIILTGVSHGQLNSMQWALGLGFNVKFIEFYVSTLDMLSIIQGREVFSISAIILWKINYKN